jgi:hypothetical protein
MNNKQIGGFVGIGVTITASVGLIAWGNKEENKVQGANLGVPIVILGFIPASIAITVIGAAIGSRIK